MPSSPVVVDVVMAYLFAIVNEWTYEKSTRRSVATLRIEFSTLEAVIPAATRPPFESICASMIALFGLEESVVVKRDKILVYEIVKELVIVDEDRVL